VQSTEQSYDILMKVIRDILFYLIRKIEKIQKKSLGTSSFYQAIPCINSRIASEPEFLGFNA
jgi:hypothetical protein